MHPYIQHAIEKQTYRRANRAKQSKFSGFCVACPPIGLPVDRVLWIYRWQIGSEPPDLGHGLPRH